VLILQSAGKRQHCFKGKPNKSGPSAALTNSSYNTTFDFSQKGKEVKVDFKIVCTFLKNGSWVKPDKKNDYLLNHEQRHFDIAECGAREIRKKVAIAKFTSKNYRTLIRKIISETESKYRQMQNTYDRETKHSIITEKQEKWNEKVDEMLKTSEDYKLVGVR
jgi:hypothetical protein